MSDGRQAQQYKRLLEGRRILVSGGSGGIGRGICAVLAREGAKVAFTWNGNRDGATATEEMLREADAKYLAIQIDLKEAAAAESVVAQLESEWDGIDGLVNNAAISESLPFVLLDDQELYDLMEINFFSVFRLCRAAVRRMVRQKYGRIVNISSIAGSRSIPGPVHYAASKGAVEGMTRSLAHEVGPYGILVNAIAAGIFEGGLRSTIPEHHQKRYLDACALGRFGNPDECGELAAWLLSDKNSYANGSIIFQEGGTLA